MNVTQLLARLSRGPLSNLSLSFEGSGEIVETKIPAIVDHINDGLLLLYSKFDLLEKEVIVELDETITNYKIVSDYSVTRAGEFPANTHYIKDGIGTPFTDDLIRILRVYTTSTGTLPLQLPLNDDNAVKSLFTPQHDLLQVPDPVQGVPLYLIYQARHPILNEDDDFDATQVVLPPILEGALISWVAHKVYLHMNGQENGAKAAEHLSSYQSIVNEVIDKDLVNSSLSSSNTKFDERGFR